MADRLIDRRTLLAGATGVAACGLTPGAAQVAPMRSDPPSIDLGPSTPPGG